MLRTSLWVGSLLVMGCAGLRAKSEPVASFGHEASSVDSSTREPAPPREQDPVYTDGDKYHLVLENERVRVLRYADRPGEKTHPHHHREFVLFALSSFRRRLIFPDGTVKERDFKPGDVIWMPEQTHVGENIGTTNTHVVIVEMKGARL